MTTTAIAQKIIRKNSIKKQLRMKMDQQMHQLHKNWKCPNCNATIFEANWYRQIPERGKVVCQACL